MPFGVKQFLLGQGPNPYGGGSAVVSMFFLTLALTGICLIVFVIRRQSSQPTTPKKPRQLFRRFAGFLVGCIFVATAAFVINTVATELEFSERVDVSDDGRVIGSGTERSEAWYRAGRAVYVFSMLGFLACGVTIGVKMQAPFLRNGVSWGMLIAAVWALFVA